MQLSTWTFPSTFRLPVVITWIPFYLSLILLLQTLTLPASTNASTYKESCSTNTDCTDTHFCYAGYCDCIKKENKIFIHFYDHSSKECKTIVGKVCARRATAGTLNLKCVPNAECAVPDYNDLEELGKDGLPDNYGVCKCKKGFERTSESLCAIPVFEHVSPRFMEGNNAIHSPTTSQVSDNKEDANKNIDVDHEANLFGKSNGYVHVISSLKVLSISLAILLCYNF